MTSPLAFFHASKNLSALAPSLASFIVDFLNRLAAVSRALLLTPGLRNVSEPWFVAVVARGLSQKSALKVSNWLDPAGS